MIYTNRRGETEMFKQMYLDDGRANCLVGKNIEARVKTGCAVVGNVFAFGIRAMTFAINIFL